MSRAKKKQDKGQEEAQAIKMNYDDVIRSNLSDIDFSMDRSTVAYSKLVLSGKKLEKPLDAIPSQFSNYKFLKHIDLSYNNVTDFSNQAILPNLISLRIKKNNISSLKAFNREVPEGEEIEYWKSLQYCDCSQNKITELGPIKAPNLLYQDLSQNDIKKMENYDGHAKLESLDLSSNGISDTTSISKMPSQKKLYIGFNRIRNMNGFDGLESLQFLHMRGNQIHSWDEAFPPLESLEYLNLRQTKVEKMEELEKLASQPKMKKLVINFTPFVEKHQETYIFHIVTKFPNLNFINKHEITREVRKQTIQYEREKWLEEKRIEEEKKKAEEEANAEGNDQYFILLLRFKSFYLL